ncbi:MAG: N-acetyl-alpha-D-glucosaminyl L-malate synthase BshA [Myxococcota bacterium]
MKSRLRIGVVCFASTGGSGVIAAELARGFADRGHRVHLIARRPPARVAFTATPVFFHAVSVANYPVLEEAPYALALASKIVEVAQEHRLDLVHAHYAVPHATSVYLAKQALGGTFRTVTTLHGTDVTRVGVEPSIQRINRFAVEASDGVTVPSEYLRDVARRDLMLSASTHIEVLPNFINTTHFHPASSRQRAVLGRLFNGRSPPMVPNERILVHVSNFRPVKRVDDAVKAFHRIQQAMPARLLLVGDGPERAKVANLARDLGIDDRTCFLGTMVEFADLIRHADLFLLPSETESFGLAALEALASGVPVVASNVGGLPEVIRDGETGRLTPVGDVDAMAQAAIELLQDPVRHEGFAQAARADAVARFTLPNALDRYESYYRRLLGGPNET